MRFPRPFRLLCSSALIAAASSAASAQVVTVSATPGAADETSIQAAVASLLPGGSRDDGNPDNNVVTIIDSAVYTEALSLAGFTGTIAGVAPTRPTIIASLQQAAANPGASAIHIASDGTVALRRLVVLPHAANPANTGILATGQTADNAGDLVLDRVLVSANDGSNAPASVDGLSAPGPGASRFLGNAFEVAGGRPGRQVRFDEVVLTGATGGGADLVRFRGSDTTMTINAGSVLSHSQGAGLRANAGAASAIRWIGEPDAPVLLRGVKTLPYRMEGHQRHALAVAEFLESHSAVRRVFYPGLASHPQHDLAKRQMSGFGGMLSFEVDESQLDLPAFIAGMEVFRLAESLGGVESLICQPWSMTHLSMPEEARLAAGITPAVFRLSVGLEDPADLVADLEAGFAAGRRSA